MAKAALQRYDAACRAVAEAKTIDEAKDIRDKAVAMAAYARQAKNRDLEADAVEIRMRATRRLDQLRQAQKETVGLNHGTAGAGNPLLGGLATNPPKDLRPTLASQGIDKNLAHQARTLGALSEEKFERAVSDARTAVRQAVKIVVRGATGTGENEWYTPAEYVEDARAVLGAIDLDPASSAEAQRVVRASRIFTLETNGLRQDWGGRVWLNPPYAQPAISEFVAKLLGELRAERVHAAIMLTHNYTDTNWFQDAAASARAICFTRGRIRFCSPNGEIAAPTQGQAFFYFGNHPSRFVEAFSARGIIVQPISGDQS